MTTEQTSEISTAFDLPKFTHRLESAMHAVLERAAGPVAPRPGDVQALEILNDALGREGVGESRALEEFLQTLVPACTAMQSPRYLGLINTSPWPLAVLCDTLISTLNNNLGATHQGPAAAYCEARVLAAFHQLLDWPSCAGGHLVPGGSAATLHALMLARHDRYPQWRELGPRHQRPRVYVTQASHFSAHKAALALGLGEINIARVACAGRGSMSISDLERQLTLDREHGFEAMAVVATAGTTGTGAIDPLSDLAEICARHRMWLHVDACYGGAGLLLPELRSALQGIERADSIAIDPHKWMFMPLAQAMVLTRSARRGAGIFTVDGASYIPDHGTHAYERGVQTSRRASSLALWTVLRAFGWSGLRQCIRETIRTTRRLEGRLAGHGLRVLPGGQLSTACARFEVEHWPAARLDQLQEEIAHHCTRSGQAWFATTRHADQTWMRFCNVNLHTRDFDVDAIADLVADVGRSLSHDNRLQTC